MVDVSPLAPLRPAPPAPSAPVAVLDGAELDDQALEQVVGGLERVYVPGLVVAD